MAKNQEGKPGEKPQPGPKHKIFIDDQEYVVTEKMLTGLQIKALGNVSAGYQLFLEQPGEDDEISDTAEIKIHSNMRFYAAPPATFG